jgi:hypothetical protein
VTQDFAKIRPEPLLEKKPAQAPPAWSMMITGIVVGMALGVFASVLVYVAGYVPPINNGPQPAAMVADRDDSAAAASGNIEGETPELRLEFYHELANYEVPVDATPVEINEASLDEPMAVQYMLQSGAFQQRERATQEMQRQQSLGLEVAVVAEQLNGRTLYLLQSGPYRTQRQLDTAENLLRRNNINTLRTRVQ